MKKTLAILGATLVLALGTIALIAQQREGGRGGPPPPMSFFITSVGKGDGANYGGLAGADAYCQMMAASAGRGAATWHAYLSTQGAGAVNEDRQRQQRLAQHRPARREPRVQLPLVHLAGRQPHRQIGRAHV